MPSSSRQGKRPNGRKAFPAQPVLLSMGIVIRKIECAVTARPPPTGLNDVDYEAIEAAVTENGARPLVSQRVRAPQPRRGSRRAARGDGAAGTAGDDEPRCRAGAAAALRRSVHPTAHPAHQGDRRPARRCGCATCARAGVDQRLCAAVDLQARAVAGLMRMGPSAPPGPAKAPVADPNPARPARGREPAARRHATAGAGRRGGRSAVFRLCQSSTGCRLPRNSRFFT